MGRKVFENLGRRFALREYITNIDTKVDITTSQDNVSPAELNKIYREALSALGIESRGVYGYVFPVQPFPREEYVTEQHVWTEFWDGTQWVVVDPTWYISSKGSDYFDKNSFHHVKFGSYQSLNELVDFFQASRFVRVTPAKNASLIEPLINVQMSAYDDTKANQQFRLIFINKSNQPVSLQAIKSSVNLAKIELIDKEISANRSLPPGGEFTVNLNFEYGLILKDKQGDIKVNIDYTTNDQPVKTNKGFLHTIRINSNISNYMSEIVLGLVLIFALISFVSFIIYHKKFATK
jgi:hypothetical protein